MDNHYVYFMASQRNGTIYTGKTNDLIKRVSQHNVKMLVYYEYYPDHWSAAAREKTIKNRRRSWKIRLIEQHNPQWRDLYEDITK